MLLLPQIISFFSCAMKYERKTINAAKSEWFTFTSFLYYHWHNDIFGCWSVFCPTSVWVCVEKANYSLFFRLLNLFLSYLHPNWAGIAQVSFLWVGFQPVILLERSRQIQRESVPKWTWPLKLIINSDPSCIVARYPIVGCRRPRVCEFTEKVGLQTLQSSGYLRILKQVLKGWSQRETGISGSRNGVVHLSFLDQRMCIPTEVVSKKLNLSHYLKRVGKVGSIPHSHKEMILACAFLCLSATKAQVLLVDTS